MALSESSPSFECSSMIPISSSTPLELDSLSTLNEHGEMVDFFQIVQILFKYTPRHLKRLVSPTNGEFFEIPESVDPPHLHQFAHISKICKYLPRHILACLLKEDDRYWIPYIIKSYKLLHHVVRFSKKEQNQSIHLILSHHDNTFKILDAIILSNVISVQSMAKAEDHQCYEQALELVHECFLILDYLLDSELQLQETHFLPALISHPQIALFNATMIDLLDLILLHRTLLPTHEDGKYDRIISRTMVSIFDVFDILSMSDDFINVLMNQAEGYSFVSIFLIVFKDYANLGMNVLYATLKLLYRMCEEEPTFLDAVSKSPECTRFNLIIISILEVASNLFSQSKFTDPITSEAVKLITVISRDQYYSHQMIEHGTFFLLKWFSIAPDEFAIKFKDVTSAELVSHLFIALGSLHTQKIGPLSRSFLTVALEKLKQSPGYGMLLKKAYTSNQGLYLPSIITNMNSVLHLMLSNPNWTDSLPIQVTKQGVMDSLSFRHDLEKAMHFNRSYFDQMIYNALKKWTDQPSTQQAKAGTRLIQSGSMNRKDQHPLLTIDSDKFDIPPAKKMASKPTRYPY